MVIALILTSYIILRIFITNLTIKNICATLYTYFWIGNRHNNENLGLQIILCFSDPEMMVEIREIN